MLRWLAIILVVAASFLAGRHWPGAPATGRHAAAPAVAPANRALRVTAVPARPAPLAEIVAATGTLRAAESVELQPEISGKVVSINFEEGAHVHRGDLLVKLNDADLRATLERAVLRRDLAQLKERRLAQLLPSAAIKQEDYDAALNELNVQRTEITITQALIAKTEIRAPFDGVIGLRFVSEGAYVAASTRIATLQNTEKLKLDFSVPEKYASRIRIGSVVHFSVPGSDQKYEGRIFAFDPRIDANTRTLVLRAICDGQPTRLFPGGFANVTLALAEISDAILVPNIAIIAGVTGKDVFVIVDGKAVRRTVVTGTRNETSTHIIEGLRPGDRVITSGLQVLRDGLPVETDEPSATSTVNSHPGTS